MRDAGGQRPIIATSRLLLAAILLVAVGLAMVAAILFQAPRLLGRDKILTDFDAFHVAGTIAREGRASDAYQASEMLLAQQQVASETLVMPWTYPPPYTLAMEGLANLPVGLAYLSFIGASFAFYLLVLRRIAGPYLPGVLIAILPVIPLIIRTGQNGFLTAGLVGWFLIAWIDGRRSAGLPLGLMVIKPHLAAGIAILTLLGRRWSPMAIAALVVLAALVLSTLAYGAGIWPAFLGGVREASEFLAAGQYPLFRMTSVYATVRSLGASPSLAILLHAIFALAALLLLLRLWFRRQPSHLIVAVACASSLFVSPYNYDYDLAILGVAIAFLLPELIERAHRWELNVLLGLTWLVAGYGMAVETLGAGAQAPALASLSLILLLAFALSILRREDEARFGRRGCEPELREVASA